MKSQMNKFVPLTKVDLVKREVWGVMAEEALDKSGEIFDYESSKPLVKAWSEQFTKATDGKSMGNVRSMHKAVAAGKVIALEFDDAAKKILIGTHVVDDAEWAKCEQGVYTGFSIGGSYAKKWSDGTAMRYTGNPSEVSLVDNPCMYGAQFTALKAEGIEEARKFVGGEEKPMIKAMCDVADLANALSSVNYIRQWLQSEAAWEGDNSPIPAKLKQWINDGAEILKELLAEEASELTADEMAMSIKVTLKKNAAIVAAFEPLKKSSEGEGAKPSLNTPKGEVPVEVEKTEKTAPAAEMQKMVADVDTLRKAFEADQTERKAQHEELTKAVTSLADVIEKLLGTPEPVKGAANSNATVVTKTADNGGNATESKDPLALMKASHAKPLPFTF